MQVQFKMIDIISVESIFDSLCAQQGYLMNVQGIKKPIIAPLLLEQWAELAYTQLKAEYSRAKSGKHGAMLVDRFFAALNMESDVAFEAVKAWTEGGEFVLPVSISVV